MNLEFIASQPFPLLTDSDSVTYSEAQSHSAQVDLWLGLNTEAIEKKLTTDGCRFRAPNSSGEKQELWIGLALKSLLTPYSEIRSVLEKIAPWDQDTIVDLGAGYGRMGFVIARHFPNVRFVGYEYVGERVKEASRCGVELIHADLSSPDFSPVEADFYFIYDYGSPQAIEKTLHDLRRIAKRKVITVIGRGRSSRDIIERNHPWLSQVLPPRHGPHWSLYFSGERK